MQERSVNNPKRKTAILLLSVFIIAICGILYELLISSISSYFQGSSILHFSIVIGLFLSFMGVGSYLSKFIKHNLIGYFISFEIILGMVGGVSTFLLYFAFSLTPYFYGVAFLLIAILGALIGIEIPILTRIVSKYETLRDAMANVLSFDYLGALFASLAFPLLLLPIFGLMRTAFFIGILNLIVALTNITLFREDLRYPKQFFGITFACLLILISGFAYSFQLSSFFEQFLYQNPIMLTRQSPYQRIVMTRWNKDIRLFIDGNLQFSSRDEYRYHEALIHVPMALANKPEHVLILGGGDGLAIRELLKHEGIGKISLVDLDKTITDLGKRHPVFHKLNEGVLDHEKVSIYNEDAYKFVENSSDVYNVVIIDLPDPNNESLGKLYSKEFYLLLKKRLAAGAVVVTQSTSPYYASDAFWCIHQTMETQFPYTLPYTVFVPTFGQWGFNLAYNPPPQFIPSDSVDVATEIKSRIQTRLFEKVDSTQLRYLTPEALPVLFHFDGDTKERPTQVNKLENQALIHYYEKGWTHIR